MVVSVIDFLLQQILGPPGARRLLLSMSALAAAQPRATFSSLRSWNRYEGLGLNRLIKSATPGSRPDQCTGTERCWSRPLTFDPTFSQSPVVCPGSGNQEEELVGEGAES